jgi:phosphoribosylformylglycinamidine cyclo-ligase
MATSDYERSGVKGQGEALSSVDKHLLKTFSFPEGAEVLTSFGGFASVIRLTPDLALAMCTDGVGSKTVVASALDRYDTVGHDCVAMNVNDLVCVGASPLALVDYIGVHTLDERRMDEMLQGLAAAAELAGIAIPGGEIAQLPDVIGSDGRAPGDERAFDLVGTAVGTLHPGRVITGSSIAPGDALIGLASSGLHSNGYTLARRVLLGGAGMRLDDHVAELGRTLGEELLEPTRIYVRAARSLWNVGIDTKGIVHITGDGFANLCRLDAACGYRLDNLPEPQAIFRLIQERGDIPETEMYRVFNMGTGLVVVVAQDEASKALEAASAAGYPARRIGTVTDRDGEVTICGPGLRGGLKAGESYFEAI